MTSNYFKLAKFSEDCKCTREVFFFFSDSDFGDSRRALTQAKRWILQHSLGWQMSVFRAPAKISLPPGCGIIGELPEEDLINSPGLGSDEEAAE